MSVAETVETPVIRLTEVAVTRVRRLMEERNLQGHALRVFVSGGGCSGLRYGMALEPEPRETDHRLTHEGFDVVVDAMSVAYLAGATIDYSEELMGGGFRIQNPNAATTCGCGQSFRTERGSAPTEAGGCNCR